MKPTDEPVPGKKNEPMMPLAWTRLLKQGDKTQRVFTTTMGSSVDLESVGLRRLLVNAVYWTLGMEERLPETGAAVDVVGEYRTRPFGFKGFQKGMRPADLK
jgi:hypothetical protein